MRRRRSKTKEVEVRKKSLLGSIGEPSTVGLEAYYKLWSPQGSNTSIHDYEGSNTGTWSGTLSVPTQNNGIIFDGVGDKIVNTQAGFRGSDSLGTITAWMKADSGSSGSRTLVASGDEAGTANFLSFRLDTNGSMEITTNDGSTVATVGTVTGLDDDTYHHVAVVSSGTAYTFYVDGSVDAVASGSDNGAWFGDISARDNLSIGAMKRNTVSDFFDGTIGEVRIYSQALSASRAKSEFELTRGRYGV